MAVRVRLTRVGSKKNAMWRVVVADQRSPRDGRFIEMIGHYNPHTQPSQIVIDRERLDHWISLGAEPSDTVRKLMRAPNSQPNHAVATEAPAEDAAAPAPEAAPPAAEAAPPAAEAAPPSEGTGDAEAAAATEDTADAQAEPEATAEDAGEAATPADDAPAGGEDAAPEADEKSG